MVDLLTITIVSTVITALTLIWAILATLVPKRRDLRNSLTDFRQRTRERLNQTNQDVRMIIFLMIGSAIIGAGLGYYVPTLAGYITVLSLLAWIVIGQVLFGKPEPEEEEHVTKSEVEKLIEKRLKEEHEKSANPES